MSFTIRLHRLKRILVLCAALLAASRVLALEPDSKELIPELQPLAWMIGSWQPHEAYANDYESPWLAGDFDRPSIHVSLEQPVTVKKAEDGQSLICVYSYQIKGQQMDVTERISWDPAARKFKWQCRYVATGEKQEQGEAETLLEETNSTWTGRVQPTRILFVKSPFAQFQRSLFTRSNLLVNILVENREYHSIQMKPELQPLAWMIGNWLPYLSNEGSQSYRLRDDRMIVRPSADGSSLQIRYSFFSSYVALWAGRGDVVETVTWDAARQQYSIGATVSIYDSFGRKDVVLTKPIRFFRFEGNNEWREVGKSAADNPMLIQRLNDRFRRRGFATMEGAPAVPANASSTGSKLTASFGRGP